MATILKKIEESFVAAAFAEAGEHDFARSVLENKKNLHRKVLLSTDCPVVTAQVLRHALNLCSRLGSVLEIHHIIPREPAGMSAMEYFEKAAARLQKLRKRLGGLGISYNYVIKEATLTEELIEIAGKRRDVLAVIIPLCECIQAQKDDFQNTVSRLFNCPVIFLETHN